MLRPAPKVAGVCLKGPVTMPVRSSRRALRRALWCLVGLVALVGAAALYDRYLDEAGGVFCSLQHEPIALSDKKICSTAAWDVLDPRYGGRSDMALIKHTDGMIYQCFWVDEQVFDFTIERVSSSKPSGGCTSYDGHFSMQRRARR